ncbi:hypothetical protein D7D82_04290 [Escherichia coli]|nr:hypothetical protein [Escherichia coli]EEW5685015.1 hypothetical protein [Escherichia coli]EEW5880932.1 hypothetical protein [Escherichia coli]EEW5885575.1 hypothetical protein [Escherichia coli]EEW5901226.1 hypothetical protein [Escherichia coli]
MVGATLANAISTGEGQKTKRESCFRGFLFRCSERQEICEALRRRLGKGRLSAHYGADKSVSN